MQTMLLFSHGLVQQWPVTGFLKCSQCNEKVGERTGGFLVLSHAELRISSHPSCIDLMLVGLLLEVPRVFHCQFECFDTGIMSRELHPWGAVASALQTVGVGEACEGLTGIKCMAWIKCCKRELPKDNIPDSFCKHQTICLVLVRKMHTTGPKQNSHVHL